MLLLILNLVLSGFLFKVVNALEVACNNESISVNTCEFRNIYSSDRSENFEIIENDEEQFDVILTVLATTSVIHYVPLGIFYKFGNLRHLNLTDVELQELSVAFENCENLESIDFSSNELQNVEKVFDECRKLKYIELEFNQIEAMAADALTKLEALEYFSASNNMIVEIPEEMFEFNTELKHLKLDFNLIERLQVGCFDSLIKLEVLMLNNNKIVNLNYQLFQKISSVQGIFLDHNQIEEFSEGIFTNLINLMQLEINYNKFKVLKMDSFRKLPKLSEFSIGNSNLDSLSNRFFDNYPNLVLLSAVETPCVDKTFTSFSKADLIYFQECFVNTLTCVSNGNHSCEIREANLKLKGEIELVEMIGSKESIEYVLATDSTLEFIPQIIFNEFENLSKLELRSVGLKEVRKIENCSALTILNLNDNEVEELPEKAFDSCQNLRELFINDNAIISIHEKAFLGLKNLEILHIKNAKVNTSSASDFLIIESPTFHERSKLVELHLTFHRPLDLRSSLQLLYSLRILKIENNDIPEITNRPFVYFAGYQKIRELHISNNQISNIRNDTFALFTLMTLLDLSNNKLISLAENLFSKTAKLSVLKLNDNLLKELPSTLHQMKNLKTLMLDSNKLKTLAEPLDYPMLESLNLSNNSIASINYIFFDSMQQLATLELFDNRCTQKNFKNITNWEKEVHRNLQSCYTNYEPCIFRNSNSTRGYTCELIMDYKETASLKSSDRKHVDGYTNDDVTHLFMKFKPVDVDLYLIFEKLPNLQEIELWNNSIQTLNFLSSCKSLRKFDFRLNKLGKDAETYLESCENLETLILVKNGISELSENSFGFLTKLIFLDLSSNYIKSFPEGFFSKMTNLKTLKLTSNKLTFTIFKIIKNLKSLKVLDLSYNEIASMNFEIFLNLNLLREIHLNGNKIAQIFPAFSTVLQNLIYLNLADNMFATLDIASDSLPKLQYLDVSNSQIERIVLDVKAQTRLRDFHAIENICIDESFENIERVDAEFLNDICV